MLVSALDEVAWLLNLRGGDVEFNPVIISYAGAFLHIYMHERITISN